MKRNKLTILLVALLGVSTLHAWTEIPDSTQNLFDTNGTVTRAVVTPREVKSQLITVNPIIDDVVWRKKVLRVVDLRELQNRPLYYPCEDLTSDTQKNLFAIIFKRILDNELKVYKDKQNMSATFVPRFIPQNLVNIDSVLISQNDQLQMLKEFANDKEEADYAMINSLTKGIIKYYVQEVWYFNKKTSTFHNKIIAIAPIYNENYGNESGPRSGTWFWVPYEKLRPFLQEEFIKYTGHNLSPLINFDDFFTSRKFYSYIIKDYDLQGLDVDDGIENPRFIREEQQRIEDEILNFEQDLWNY